MSKTTQDLGHAASASQKSHRALLVFEVFLDYITAAIEKIVKIELDL